MSKADLEEKKQRIAELHAQVQPACEQHHRNPNQRFLLCHPGRKKLPLARLSPALHSRHCAWSRKAPCWLV